MKMRLFAVLGTVGLLSSLTACVVTTNTGGSGGQGGEAGGGAGVGGGGGQGGQGGQGGAGGGSATCLTCSEIDYTKTKDAYCTADTDPNKLDAQGLFQAVFDCACGAQGACAAACKDDACAGKTPGATCSDCILKTGCKTQYEACTADTP